MQVFTSLLNISGQGQNVGKTLFACGVIRKFGNDYPITGLKISPHHHKNTGVARLIKNDNVFSLFTETDANGSKDTSRMLASGAQRAYLLQAPDEALYEGLRAFWQEVGRDSLVVCESQRFTQIFIPGLSFFIQSPDISNEAGTKIQSSYPNSINVICHLNKFDFDFNKLTIFNNQWILKK